MVYIFAKTIKNIFSNFIPHETILCEKLINEENTACESYIENGKNKQ